MRNGLSAGARGGVLGLAAMELVKRLTRPIIRERAPEPMDVFPAARSMSVIGPRHEPDESATDALGRIAYTRVVGHRPSPNATRLLSWGVHIGYGLLVATVYGLVRARRARRHVVRDGVIFGTGLWLFGDELVVPLLGLQDKPNAYHPTRHLHSLLAHLGFGITTAAAAQR